MIVALGPRASPRHSTRRFQLQVPAPNGLPAAGAAVQDSSFGAIHAGPLRPGTNDGPRRDAPCRSPGQGDRWLPDRVADLRVHPGDGARSTPPAAAVPAARGGPACDHDGDGALASTAPLRTTDPDGAPADHERHRAAPELRSHAAARRRGVRLASRSGPARPAIGGRPLPASTRWSTTSRSLTRLGAVTTLGRSSSYFARRRLHDHRFRRSPGVPRQEVIFMLEGSNHFDIAHEIAHTLLTHGRTASATRWATPRTPLPQPQPAHRARLPDHGRRPRMMRQFKDPLDSIMGAVPAGNPLTSQWIDQVHLLARAAQARARRRPAGDIGPGPAGAPWRLALSVICSRPMSSTAESTASLLEQSVGDRAARRGRGRVLSRYRYFPGICVRATRGTARGR